nr:MAG TPA_asm: hypothetical protein [Bacteriophage sp.]DAP05580.1 MAG TPA: hypothetical protein [Caudoviricetes sp.]
MHKSIYLRPTCLSSSEGAIFLFLNCNIANAILK